MSGRPSPPYFMPSADNSTGMIIALLLIIVLGVGGYFYYRYYKIKKTCGDTKNVFKFSAIPSSACATDGTVDSSSPVADTPMTASMLYNGSNKNDLDSEITFLKNVIDNENSQELINYFDLYQGGSLYGYTVANVTTNKYTANVSCGASSTGVPVADGVIGFTGCKTLCDSNINCIGFEMAYDLTNINTGDDTAVIGDKTIHKNTCFLKSGELKETSAPDKRNCYANTVVWNKKYKVTGEIVPPPPPPPPPPSGGGDNASMCQVKSIAGTHFWDTKTNRCLPLTKTCPTDKAYTFVPSLMPQNSDNTCVRKNGIENPTCAGGLTYQANDWTAGMPTRLPAGHKGACYSMDCARADQSTVNFGPYSSSGIPPLCGYCGGSQYPMSSSTACGDNKEMAFDLYGLRSFNTNDRAWQGTSITDLASIDPTIMNGGIKLPLYMMAGANIWIACDDTNGRMFANKYVDMWARVYSDFAGTLTAGGNLPFPGSPAELDAKPSIKSLIKNFGADKTVNVHTFMGAFDSNYKFR